MAELNASIESQVAVGDAAIVRFRPDSGRVPRFRPGQHTHIGVVEDGVLMLAPYSIASSPTDGCIEIYTHRTFTGRVHLAEHASGVLTLDEVPRDRDLLLIATGTGISPFISMYRTFKNDERWRSLTVVHGVRRVADLAYRDELQAPNVNYVPVVSRGPFDGARGHVQNAIDLSGLDRERTHAFLCGRGDMVASVETLLASQGFTHVHMEKYA